MPLIPKNELSHFVGRLVHKKLPQPLGPKSVEWFAKYYQINLDEAEFPISHYRSIGELFTRKLKDGLRPISSANVVHPADAQISETGNIENFTLIQAKGKTYSVTDLLRNQHFAESFSGGSFVTYYLCPTDYHRVHSPVDGKIIWSCHVPGELWPVNQWSVNKINNLFSINERVIVMIQTPMGKAALVMVAATNVGNMTMSFDGEINTQFRTGARRPREHTYTPEIEIGRGEEVGIFHMGSTVVMLYEKGMLNVDFESLRSKKTKMGESFARV